MAGYTELRIAGLTYGGSAWGNGDTQHGLFNRSDFVHADAEHNNGLQHVYSITVAELRRRIRAVGYTPTSVEASVRDVAASLLGDLPNEQQYADSRSFLNFVRAQTFESLVELVRDWRARATKDGYSIFALLNAERAGDFPTALVELLRGGSPPLAMSEGCPMHGHVFECLLCEVCNDEDLFEYDWTDVAIWEEDQKRFDPIGQSYDQLLSMQDKQSLVRGGTLDDEEGDTLEFKTVSSDNVCKTVANHVAKYATAFLNRNGGRILFGVTDKGVVEGIRISRDQRDELHRLVNAALVTITPSVPLGDFPLTYRSVIGAANTLNDCFVVELAVPRGKPNEMYFLNDLSYARFGTETRMLRGHALFAHIYATYCCSSRMPE